MGVARRAGALCEATGATGLMTVCGGGSQEARTASAKAPREEVRAARGAAGPGAPQGPWASRPCDAEATAREAPSQPPPPPEPEQLPGPRTCSSRGEALGGPGEVAERPPPRPSGAGGTGGHLPPLLPAPSAAAPRGSGPGHARSRPLSAGGSGSAPGGASRPGRKDPGQGAAWRGWRAGASGWRLGGLRCADLGPRGCPTAPGARGSAAPSEEERPLGPLGFGSSLEGRWGSLLCVMPPKGQSDT